ncbi:MAG: glycosyltransferase family 2 protein [Alphaproteobacteria bacterium]|nr:glycosyltransferase family 2 protein [Alphaproteobacteria bacterium]MBU2378738.1 glycosyltransferase family 2 protein [Alphaproteobacteria bacterium]
MTSVAVVILTFNEQIHLARALASVRPFATEVFVIDSGSTDETVAIARAAGAQVLPHPFVNYAQQFQWGLDNAPISADWIMRLDADEVVEDDLAAEIKRRLDGLSPGITGVSLKRKHVFMGRWIKHGGRYPLTMLRIWRRGKGRIEQRWMDEHIVLDAGSSVTFDGGFADINLKDLTYFTDKHNKYATREAIDVLNTRYGLSETSEDNTVKGSSLAVAGKRWLKEQVYNRASMGAGPLLYFLYRYFVQAGFLDGPEGLIYHGLQGFWYRFLVAAKVAELDRELSPLTSRAERVNAVERLTGHRL